MIRVTVNRDGIDKGVANPITLEKIDGRNAPTYVGNCTEVELYGTVRLRYEPDAPLADGTRVWIECDSVGIKRRA